MCEGKKPLTGMENAEVFRLSSMVEYQPGAVVSRTLVDRKIGTVTIFAFDRSQGLSEHTAPFDALVQIIEGEAEITISGKQYNMVSGEIIKMPAGEPHSLRAGEQFKMLLTMIRE